MSKQKNIPQIQRYFNLGQTTSDPKNPEKPKDYVLSFARHTIIDATEFNDDPAKAMRSAMNKLEKDLRQSLSRCRTFLWSLEKPYYQGKKDEKKEN